jgi:anti-sigma-K factor RskA
VAEAGDSGPATISVRRVPPRRGLRIKLESIGWAAALLFVITSGLFVYAWSASGPHASPEVEMLARLPGGQLVKLAGTGAPTASARLYVVEGGRRAELTVDALPPLPRGRVYQLWFTEPGQPTRTGGAFGVDPRGDAVVQVAIPTPIERVRAVAVTQEPAPGSPAPTGVNLLNWTP